MGDEAGPLIPQSQAAGKLHGSPPVLGALVKTSEANGMVAVLNLISAMAILGTESCITMLSSLRG